MQAPVPGPGDEGARLWWWLWARALVLLLVVVAGTGFRMWAAARGHNYDFDSFLIVASLADHGQNVYAHTARYNYGPVWFHVLHGLYLVAGRNQATFRSLLAGFLTLVDLGIFFVLLRACGRLAACLFFLNPISIIITGYHSQFGNLSILLALVSVVVLGEEDRGPLGRRGWASSFLLGLSLMTKHIFFAYPFWLALRQRGIYRRFVVLVLPVAIFLIGFLPYWQDGRAGIINNVFLYRSYANEYFYKLLVPGVVHLFCSSRNLWVAVLCVAPFFCRRRSNVDSLLIYSGVLVAASPAVANQYLAIPVPLVSVHFNLFSALYTGIGTCHLLVDHDALNLATLQAWLGYGRDVYYPLLVSLLWLSLLSVGWCDRLTPWLKRLLDAGRRDGAGSRPEE